MTAEPIDRIPRPMIIAVGVMLAITLAGTAALRYTGTPPMAQGPVEAAATDRVSILIREQPGGQGTRLLDPATGAEVAVFGPGEDGFIRGLLRVLDRTRMQHGVAPDGPVEIVRWSDGHHALIDPATGWRAELIGFGADNFAVFATVVSGIVDTREDDQ